MKNSQQESTSRLGRDEKIRPLRSGGNPRFDKNLSQPENMQKLSTGTTTGAFEPAGPPLGRTTSFQAIDPASMDWRRDLIERLETAVPGGYSARGEAASEPTALAGLALHASGRTDAARCAADWLVQRQAESGAVGVTATQPTPCWPTSLALLLWQAIGDEHTYGTPAARAVEWVLQERGKTCPQRPFVGHDSMLVGWSWAAQTHSWLEPTAMFVLALKAAGRTQHPRTREGVRLLIDRLLPAWRL